MRTKLLLLLLTLATFASPAATVSINVTVQNSGTATAYGTALYWRAATSPPGTSIWLGGYGTMTAGSSQTKSVGWDNASGTIYVWVRYYTNSGQTGTWFADGSYQVSSPHTAGDTLTMVMLPGGAAPDPHCWNVKVNNVGNGRLFYSYCVDCVSPPAPSLETSPGYSMSASWNDASGGNHTVDVWRWTGVGGESPVATHIYGSTTSDWSTNCSSPNVTINDDGYNFTTYNTGSTNPPIDWSGTATNGGLALDATLRKGTEAIYTAIKDFADRNHQDQTSIQSLIGGLQSNLGTKLDTLHSDNTSQSSVLSQIASNTASAASSPQLAAIMTNGVYGNGRLDSMVNLNSNINAYLSSINTRADNLGYIRSATESGNTFLGNINTKAGDIKNRLDGWDGLLTLTRDNITSMTGDSAVIRSNLALTYGKMTDAARNLTNILSALGPSNLLTADMLAKLSAMALTQTNVEDGIARVNVNLGSVTNALKAINDSADLIAAKLAASTNQGQSQIELLSQVATNTAQSSNYFAVNLTNQVSISNSFDAAGIIGAIGNFHADNTNLLGQVVSALNRTNAGGTNVEQFSYVNTNLGTITSQASTTVGPLQTKLDEVKGYFLGWTEPDPPGVSGMSISMVGYTWDFNPLSNTGVADMFSLARRLFAWLIVCGYGLKVFTDIMEFVKVMAQAQQMSWPKFELFAQAQFLGIGGGGGGTVSAVLIPVIAALILAVSAAACLAVSLLVGAFFSGEVVSVIGSNPIGGFVGAVGNGVNLARHFFPFTVFFSTLVSYVVWKFGVMGSSSILAVSIRMIVGG